MMRVQDDKPGDGEVLVYKKGVEQKDLSVSLADRKGLD
eukprot:gene15392-4614_t